MGLQGNIVLLLLGALQAILLTVLLIRKKVYRSGYIFLILYLVTLTAQVLFKVADKYWLMQNVTKSYFLSHYLPLLYGPLAFLFTRNVLSREPKLRSRDLLHFIPFLYSAIVVASVNIFSELGWLYRPLNGYAGLTIQMFSIGIYHYLAWKYWNNYTGGIKQYYSDLHSVKVRWLGRFLLYSFITTVALSILLVFLYKTHPTYYELRFGFLLLSVFIYWISYCALSQPAIFSVIKGNISSTEEKRIPALSPIPPVSRYNKSRLKEEEVSRIVTALHSLMVSQRLYTDPELNIEKLSALINTRRHILSQVLNETLRISFYDYVNSYRVEEVKQLLQDPSRADHKIASITYDAGFNSLSTFNDVFRKLTGQTPTQFKKFSLVSRNVG